MKVHKHILSWKHSILLEIVLPNIRKYFPEGEEGDIQFYCWLMGITREQLEEYAVKDAATKPTTSEEVTELLEKHRHSLAATHQ